MGLITVKVEIFAVIKVHTNFLLGKYGPNYMLLFFMYEYSLTFVQYV